MGFHMKVPTYQRFHTFLWRFHTFISHLKIFNLDHKDHLINCYKNIQGLHGFSYENSSISMISHPFLGFFTPFFHTSKFSIWTIKTAQSTATRIYKVCMGFHMKIPLYQRFHTFFGRFHTFFSHLQIFKVDHKTRLIECYKNI